MWVRKKTQYGGHIVMFLLNKIIKNVGLAHGFKTVVLKPCPRHFKQPIVLLYVV